MLLLVRGMLHRRVPIILPSPAQSGGGIERLRDEKDVVACILSSWRAQTWIRVIVTAEQRNRCRVVRRRLQSGQGSVEHRDRGTR